MNSKFMVSFILGCIVVLLLRCSPAGESTAFTDTGPESWTDNLEEYKKTWPDKFGIGRSADKDFIARWDIDVRPDGKGLPKGTGRAKNGALIYSNKCASCHGINGVEGPEDNLVTSSNGRNTIGNYWPYATTIFDYVRRAMPFNAPGSLTDQEVYDLTAYLLFLNGIINVDYSLTEQTLPAIEMPAKRKYVLDDRQGGPEIR